MEAEIWEEGESGKWSQVEEAGVCKTFPKTVFLLMSLDLAGSAPWKSQRNPVSVSVSSWAR